MAGHQRGLVVRGTSSTARVGRPAVVAELAVQSAALRPQVRRSPQAPLSVNVRPHGSTLAFQRHP